MKKDNLQLPVPPAVEFSTKSMEMIRVWIVDGHQEIVISSNLWKDSGSWGILLVDIARHVANMYSKIGGKKETVLLNIKSAFDAEWSNPTE